ncbi:hypothetical protein HanPI659440_Chr09g0354221 [Helianthus annuus]|nr:hypothetical protein HanPI659440_Chr09g0354221 [Helianthus annuus]
MKQVLLNTNKIKIQHTLWCVDRPERRGGRSGFSKTLTHPKIHKLKVKINSKTKSEPRLVISIARGS